MPEGYVHVCIARQAAQAAGWPVRCAPAFMAGANGPDMFYCFEAWKPAAARRMDLPGFGDRLHGERTGAFLRALHRYAVTPAQQDYFMGFLAHYAVDCTVHPYVVAVTQSGMPYAGPGGHGYFEIALDSFVHKHCTGDGAVPVDDICPPLPGEAMAQVAAQLRRAAAEVFGEELPAELVADAFAHNHMLRGLFQSRLHIKYGLFWLLEPLFGGRGRITCHISPRDLYGQTQQDKRAGRTLPAPWADPCTGQVHPEDLWQLLRRAQHNTDALFQQLLAAGGMTPGTAGTLPQPGPAGPLAEFWQAVGSADYVTGTATPASAQGAVCAPQQQAAR